MRWEFHCSRQKANRGEAVNNIEDETNGSIGLSYPKMNGISPFICLPRAISLDIISNIGLFSISTLS